MRNVLRNHREVADYWAANRQPSGRASRMFFENKIIYSYGYHFPIAKILDGRNCLFTLAGYSNSTSKHILHTRRAADKYGLKIIYCYSIGSKDESLSYWEGQINDLIKQIKHPANRKFEGRACDLKSNASQLRKYIDFMKIELSFEQSVTLSFIENHSNDDIIKILREDIRPRSK